MCNCCVKQVGGFSVAALLVQGLEVCDGKKGLRD